MARFIGFSADQLVVVDRIFRVVRYKLENITLNKMGSKQFRDVFGRIMGGGDLDEIKAAEKVLEDEIRTMFKRVATFSYQVSYGDPVSMGGANASMLSGQYTQSGGTGAQHTSFIEGMRGNTAPDRLPMKLGAPFFAMPDYDLFEQSKVETFLHELSHHAAGTIDDEDGGNCYEWAGVNRLKGLGPARAVRNAENVGFFITWLG